MNIVFDIGGTNMRVAGAERMILGDIRKVPTPQDLSETIATLVEIAREISGRTIDRAAGCFAGWVDPVQGVYDANNRKHWSGRHFDTELSDALGVPVAINNDCAVIALGEQAFGAGKGSGDLAYVTVSTGVGAGHVIDGTIVPVGNFHIGHVHVSGEELENLVSGTAVKKKFGIEPKELDSIEERNKLADILARGLAKMVEEWKPDMIVLGGSMITGVNPIPLPRVQESLAKLFVGSEIAPPVIKMASLGDSGGLHGAAILASQQ